MKNRNKFLIVLLCIFLVLGSIVLLSANRKYVAPYVVAPDMSQQPIDGMPARTTLTGTYTACLPRHDNFNTEDCVIGMKATDGSYYALDFNLMSQTAPKFKEGDRLTANGVLTPMEMISSDPHRYAIGKGVFSITSIVEAPKKADAGKCYIGGCSAQICSDQPDMASICEYREEYACYKKATCERQATGSCGWTPSKELSACLGS